jgi:hypothetical protein
MFSISTLLSFNLNCDNCNPWQDASPIDISEPSRLFLIFANRLGPDFASADAPARPAGRIVYSGIDFHYGRGFQNVVPVAQALDCRQESVMVPELKRSGG